jgi:hypothetical protein
MADAQQAPAGVAITDAPPQLPEIATDKLAHRLLEVLGLDKSTVSYLSVVLQPGKPITIHVSMLTSVTCFNKITDEFEDEMKHFTLVENRQIR